MKNDSVTVAESQAEFERLARRTVAIGLRRGWVRHGSGPLDIKQAIEKFKALGMIGEKDKPREKAKQDERFFGVRHRGQ